MAAAVSLLAVATPAFGQESKPVTLGDKEVGTVSVLGANDPKRDFCIQNSGRLLHFKMNEKGSLVILMCRHAAEATITPEDSCAYAQHVESLFQRNAQNSDPRLYNLVMDDIGAMKEQLCGKKEKEEGRFEFQSYAAGLQVALKP